MFAVTQYIDPQARPIPRHHHEYLVTHLRPPRYANVWQRRYVGRESGDHILGSLGSPEPGLNPTVYWCILRVGQVLIELMARTTNTPLAIVPALPGSYVSVWPPPPGPASVVWPPRVFFGDVAWAEFRRNPFQFGELGSYRPLSRGEMGATEE
jgi:hypothetical protein